MQKTKKFWAYDFSQQQDIKQEYIESTKLKGRFYDDLSSLYYEFLGSPPHPALKQPYGKEHTEPTYISFLNILVDINSLRMLFHVLPNSKIISLKFSSNLLEFANFEFLINSVNNKPNNIFNFIYEWNSEFKYEGKIYTINKNHPNYIKPITVESVSSPKNIVNSNMNSISEIREVISKYEEYIIKLSLNPKIEALCLRGNYLGDEHSKLIFENLKANTTLRVLNLYKNNLTSDCINLFCEMLEINKKIEEINIGGNSFTDEDLIQIKNCLGKLKLTPNYMEDYSRRTREREAAIERNKRNKAAKKPEEPIPNIEDIVQEGDNFFIIKNTKLRTINLMQNNFTEECFETIINMLDLSQDLLITIDNKIFPKNLRDKLNHPHSKYANRIYLAK